MLEETNTLKSVSDVVAALGGNSAIVALVEAQSTQVVTNWVARNRFASHTYLILTQALAERGFTADPKLWGITPAEPHALPAETVE